MDKGSAACVLHGHRENDVPASQRTFEHVCEYTYVCFFASGTLPIATLPRPRVFDTHFDGCIPGTRSAWSA